MRTLLGTVLVLLFNLSTLSAQSGDSYSTLYNDAIQQIDQQHYLEARTLLSKAIVQKSDFAEAIFARGTCSLMLKEWDLACADFEKSAALNWKPAHEYIEKYCGKDSYGRKVNKSKK